jgi:hypothetical protein
MRKPAFYFTAMILTMCAAVFFAQAQEKPKPQFKLTISDNHSSMFAPPSHRISMMVTNISSEVFIERGCSEMMDIYHISVFYKGVALEEKDAAARHRSEAWQAAHCTWELGSNPVNPGESFQIWFDVGDRYNMSKPGVYEVTVFRETDPDHPEHSITVKSNTLTVVVPKPGASAAQ